MTELRPWVWCLPFFWNTVYMFYTELYRPLLNCSKLSVKLRFAFWQSWCFLRSIPHDVRQLNLNKALKDSRLRPQCATKGWNIRAASCIITHCSPPQANSVTAMTITYYYIHMPSLCKNMTSSRKPEVYKRIVVRGGSIHCHRQKYSEFHEVGTCGFWDMWVDTGQTNTQTDTPIAIPCPRVS